MPFLVGIILLMSFLEKYLMSCWNRIFGLRNFSSKLVSRNECVGVSSGNCSWLFMSILFSVSEPDSLMVCDLFVVGSSLSPSFLMTGDRDRVRGVDFSAVRLG